MKVKATRRFWFGGRLVEPGEELEVPESLAREVIASNKAEPAPEAEPAERIEEKEPAGLPGQ